MIEEYDDNAVFHVECTSRSHLSSVGVVLYTQAGGLAVLNRVLHDYTISLSDQRLDQKKKVMAAAQDANTTVRTFSPELRVVVDDVDEDRLHPACDGGRWQKSKSENESDMSNWENPTARIKRIQVEAECRKMEFARLLEEHAQVIRKLKQIEEREMPHLISNSVANVTKACGGILIHEFQ